MNNVKQQVELTHNLYNPFNFVAVGDCILDPFISGCSVISSYILQKFKMLQRQF